MNDRQMYFAHSRDDAEIALAVGTKIAGLPEGLSSGYPENLVAAFA